MLAESARSPAIADIVRRRDRGRRELLGRLLRTGQERAQIDPDLDPDIAAVILANIFETLGHQTMRDPGFDTKRGAEMLKLLVRRFLLPRAVADQCLAAKPEQQITRRHKRGAPR